MVHLKQHDKLPALPSIVLQCTLACLLSLAGAQAPAAATLTVLLVAVLNCRCRHPYSMQPQPHDVQHLHDLLVPDGRPSAGLVGCRSSWCLAGVTAQSRQATLWSTSIAWQITASTSRCAACAWHKPYCCLQHESSCIMNRADFLLCRSGRPARRSCEGFMT